MKSWRTKGVPLVVAWTLTQRTSKKLCSYLCFTKPLLLSLMLTYFQIYCSLSLKLPPLPVFYIQMLEINCFSTCTVLNTPTCLFYCCLNRRSTHRGSRDRWSSCLRGATWLRGGHQAERLAQEEEEQEPENQVNFRTKAVSYQNNPFQLHIVNIK